MTTKPISGCCCLLSKDNNLRRILWLVSQLFIVPQVSMWLSLSASFALFKAQASPDGRIHGTGYDKFSLLRAEPFPGHVNRPIKY